MAQSMLGLLGFPPNSLINRLRQHFAYGQEQTKVRRVGSRPQETASDGRVNSHASTSILCSMPGKSLSNPARWQLTRVEMRKRGKNISKTETSKVGAANCRKRET